MIKDWFKRIIPIIVISIIGISSFFHPGFFPSHDGEWMVVRFSDFHRSLADGQWPVRWAGRLNFGYGYPVFNFLYPGTFYLTEFFHLLKLNFVDSVKATFVFSFILSGFFMYLFAKEWWGKWGGLASAVLYLYTPYRFVDMYVRGSLGESVAFMFPPLILWAITKIFKNTNDTVLIWIAIGALGIAGLITTHNVIAYLFMPLIILFILFLHLKCSSQKNVNLLTVYCLLFTVLGIAVSAFFWLPALWDKQYTIFDQVVISDFSKNFASIKELIFPSWGYGPSRPEDPASMSFQIGIVNILIVISTLIMIVMLNEIQQQVRDDKRNLAIATFFLTITIIAIFFMTPFSQPLWQFIPGLSLIQFPWRILSITTFSSAFLAGFVVSNLSAVSRWQIILAAIIIISALLFNFSYAKPKEFINRGEGYYSTNDDTTTVQNEYLPVWAKNLPRERAANKVEILKGQGTINDLIAKSNKTGFLYQGTKGLIKVNTVYFPGWEVLVNEQKHDIIVDKQGLMVVKVNAGTNNLLFLFKETPLRKFSDIISFISLVGITVLMAVGIKRKIVVQ